ncbi:hypothetical protein [Niabella drilacis]|nr:hypothetical protein [Niabella drilacis]
MNALIFKPDPAKKKIKQNARARFSCHTAMKLDAGKKAIPGGDRLIIN